MTLGVLGQKLGMTRIFDDAGISQPVTVIHVQPNRITARKTVESDGYESVQITTGTRKTRHLSKAQIGQFAKAGVEAGRVMREFRLDGVEFNEEDMAVGGEVGLSLFEAGQKVDVTGTSIGKGFAGGVKRHNFQMQDATHGNSISHRAPGSIGQNQTPGRVKEVILIKGAVPGPEGGDVVIKPAVKTKVKAK